MRRSLENVQLSPMAVAVNDNVSVIQGASRPTATVLVRITVLEGKWIATELYVVHGRTLNLKSHER